jgi:hypothetical protein
MIVKNLVVANGNWTDRDGKERTNWLTIGHRHEHEGKEYLTLKREINLAGLVVQKDGDSRVFVREYDPNPVEKEDLPF